MTAFLSITLKHCSLSQKHFNPAGEQGQLSQCRVTPFSQRHRNWHVLCSFWFECYKDKCRYITWEHKAASLTMCIDPRKASWGTQTSKDNGVWQRSYRVNVLEDLHKDVLYDCYMRMYIVTRHDSPRGEIRVFHFLFSALWHIVSTCRNEEFPFYPITYFFLFVQFSCLMQLFVKGHKT